jgi:hypothetical protein
MESQLQTAIREFIEQCARRDGSRAVPESEIRGAIRGYVKCFGIAHRSRRELTPAQIDRALRLYHRRRIELHRQPPLLAA